MCYQGRCVNSALYLKNATLGNPCNPNPCKNGGICVQNTETSLLSCKCSFGKNYTGMRYFNG